MMWLPFQESEPERNAGFALLPARLRRPMEGASRIFARPRNRSVDRLDVDDSACVEEISTSGNRALSPVRSVTGHRLTEQRAYLK